MERFIYYLKEQYQKWITHCNPTALYDEITVYNSIRLVNLLCVTQSTHKEACIKPNTSNDNYAKKSLADPKSFLRPSMNG